MFMDESFDGDDSTVEQQSTSATVSDIPDDVTDISRCEEPVCERLSNMHARQSDAGGGGDEAEGMTLAGTVRPPRLNESQFAAVKALPPITSDEYIELWTGRPATRPSRPRNLQRRQDRQENLVFSFQECSVCLEVVKLDTRPCCGLLVCQDCMKKHVVTQLQEVGVVHVGCPNSACHRFVLQDEIRELLRSMPELLVRYNSRLVDVNADPQLKTCPRCRLVTEAPTTQMKHRRAAKMGVLVDCPHCQLIWCFACQAPWHEGLSCAKNRAGDKLLKRWAREKSRSQYNAQRCPKCKIYIERISGCDHMQCSQCKTKFCYRCGGRRSKLKVFGYRLEHHDKKYSIIGCNDRFDYNKRLRRIFARGCIFGAKVVGGLVAAPVICGVATVAVPVYAVYRLVRRARRSPDTEFPVVDFDDFIAELNIDDLTLDFDDDDDDDDDGERSQLSEYEYIGLDIKHQCVTGVPPLPPRQPIHFSSTRRRPPPVPSSSVTAPHTEFPVVDFDDFIAELSIEDLALDVVDDDDNDDDGERSQLSEYIDIKHRCFTEVPPLPPRQPIHFSSTSPRRRPSSSLIDNQRAGFHDTASAEIFFEDVDINALQQPVPPLLSQKRGPIFRHILS